MRIKEIINCLEELAPRSLQESYDNSGLLVGNAKNEVTKVLISLDATEEIVEEAISRGCNLIISHHPIVFSGLTSFTGKNYVERTVMAAIKNDVALYAIHTNLDNIHTGVNRKIGEKLGIKSMRVLAPKKGLLKKLVVFIPEAEKDAVVGAMFEAGGGKVGEYDECSFQLSGAGTFRGSEQSNPSIGIVGVQENVSEVRIEMILENHRVSKVVSAMIQAHPYEEVAYDIYTLDNKHQQIGSGMIGQLDAPMYSLDFLKMLKDTFGGVVRYTSLVKDQISKVAWCGGSGSFLLGDAKTAGADIFVSSDFKYHQFFDSEDEIIIADIGHYENEQFTKELLADILIKKFPNFAILLTERNTNPINYL